ncbi:hypothetical protein F511_43388 [Dorcoceras hygrometricum]|uniref:Reverse transcriptase zinc-binding domain-containing protein n=1 Tax=Dorcoceras hygrometricum TaxID=472368 RepID=A0A2Z6ZZC8_9LAMI|nr:hypothetical protein F511_43388 [Dorcoceras hygrometricum]
MRTLWKFQAKKDTLWVKWISWKYGDDLWAWTPRKDDSILFKKMVLIHDELVSLSGSVDAASQLLQKWNMKAGTGADAAYRFLSNGPGIWPWKPLIWKSCLLPKHRFIMWMFAHKRLLTKDRQPYVSDKRCVFGYPQDESHDHLFFHCKFAVDLWTKLTAWLGLQIRFTTSNRLL